MWDLPRQTGADHHSASQQDSQRYCCSHGCLQGENGQPTGQSARTLQICPRLVISAWASEEWTRDGWGWWEAGSCVRGGRRSSRLRSGVRRGSRWEEQENGEGYFVMLMWSGDTTWCWGSWWTLVLAVTCCLMALSHYLNQCWCFVNRILR